MKVLFVYPNVGTGHPDHVPPGIASMSAVLKHAGHDTGLIDLSQEMDKDEFQARVKAYDPDLVGFSATTNQWHFTSLYARLIREVTNAPMVCGGYHPTLSPEETVEDPYIDWTIRGEGEDALFDLADALEHDRSPDDIPNLWGGPNKVKNPVRPPIANLDSLPFLDWDIFDNETVLQKSGGNVELCLGRGCPKDCTYCCNPQWKELYRGKGTVVRKFSVPRAIEEIKRTVSKFQPQGFLFFDEVFPIKKEWLKEFCIQYKEQIGLPFHVQIRIDMIDDEMMVMLKDAGCVSFLTGVEVGDESYRMTFLNRIISNDEIRWFFRRANELGIATFAFVMFGLPKETPKQIRSTIRLVKELNLDHVQSTIYYPFPKTALYDLAIKEGYFTGERWPSALTEKSLLNQPQLSEKLLQRA